MLRINSANKAIDLFGSGKHGFQDGNPVLGTQATWWQAAWPNAVQEELAGIVESTGVALNPSANNQIKTAIDLMIYNARDNFKAAPTVDAGLTGAQTQPGFRTGHIGIGNGISGLHSFVGLEGAEYYLNVDQEVRGTSYAVYNTRTTPDEGTLGWDFFGGMAAVVVTQNNTQFIRGNMKAHVGELYFQAPLAGPYTSLKAHNYQATIVELGAGVTLENWYGLVVNSPPTGGGTINHGYGVYIQSMDMPSDGAAIKLDGQGNGGRIKWTGVAVTEDSGGKLSIECNNQMIAQTNCLTVTSAFAGAASALPGAPAGYERRLVNGTARRYPFWNDA